MLHGKSVGIDGDIANPNKLKVTFGYHPMLIASFKAMAGARYHQEGGSKYWTIDANSRNLIAIKRLAGINPYPQYDEPIVNQSCQRAAYFHQNEGLSFILTRRAAILGFDPGTGKSLIGIETIEQSGCKNPLWISTKNAIASTRLELKKWGCRVLPALTWYDQLPSMIKNWIPGVPAPDCLILDEGSRLKNPSTKRYQAAEHLCNSVRTEHKKPIILIMTGSPAPRDPTDWWALIELCAPGWLPEGSKTKLAATLAFIRPTETADARVFNKVLGWKDDENKCAKCGLFIDDHDPATMLIKGIPAAEHHTFTPSINEVKRLGTRLTPICLVRTKDQCLDLPAQIFRPYIVEPTQELLNAADLLLSTAPSAIQALILMRELSDGFQYETSIEPLATCVCGGVESDPPCNHCHGSGVIYTKDRKLHSFPTSKDDALKDLLEEFEDDKRIIIYSGFQASVDRCVNLVREAGWEYVRLDGRGIQSSIGAKSVEEANEIFQDPKFSKNLAWIGHAMSGGMGLTLTASKAIVYYSLDSNLEAFLQSKDRNYRIGTKGSTIIPLFHLPVDKIMWDKHLAKQKLMHMTMNELKQLWQQETEVKA